MLLICSHLLQKPDVYLDVRTVISDKQTILGNIRYAVTVKREFVPYIRMATTL